MREIGDYTVPEILAEFRGKDPLFHRFQPNEREPRQRISRYYHNLTSEALEVLVGISISIVCPYLLLYGYIQSKTDS